MKKLFIFELEIDTRIDDVEATGKLIMPIEAYCEPHAEEELEIKLHNSKFKNDFVVAQCIEEHDLEDKDGKEKENLEV